jgi:hypothetical protein
LVTIVENYYNQQFITKNFHDEYLRFIKALINETNKILDEKRRREEEKLKIKFSL